MDNATPLKVFLFIGGIIFFAGVLPMLCAHIVSRFIKKGTGVDISPITTHKYSKERRMGMLLGILCFFGIVFIAGKGFSLYFSYKEERDQRLAHAQTQAAQASEQVAANRQAEWERRNTTPPQETPSLNNRPHTPPAATSRPAATTTSPEQVAAQREQLIAAQFDPESGAHLKLENYIQRNRNFAPGSYRHDHTDFVDHGDYLVVTTTFFASDSTTYKQYEWVAKVNLDGFLMGIISEKTLRAETP